MKPVYQTTFGKKGNCLPACIASILELSIEETDCFAAHRHDWRERLDKFLASRGLFYIEFDFRLPKVCTEIPTGALVIAGAHEGRDIAHAVVAIMDGPELQLFHDPSPVKHAELTFDSIMLLCRLDTI